MRVIGLIILCGVILTSCRTKKIDPIIVHGKVEEVKEVNEIKEYQEYSGHFVKKEFIKKGSKIGSGMFDIYMMTMMGEYFIKSYASEEIKKEIESTLKDQRMVTVKAELGEGLWDTDDPYTQSRTGKYMIIHEIVK